VGATQSPEINLTPVGVVGEYEVVMGEWGYRDFPSVTERDAERVLARSRYTQGNGNDREENSDGHEAQQAAG
jgi:hypothetical protein